MQVAVMSPVPSHLSDSYFSLLRQLENTLHDKCGHLGSFLAHTQRSVNPRAEPGCRSTKGTQLNGAAAAILRIYLIRVGVPGSLSLIDMRDSMPRAVARMLNSRHRYFPAAMNRVLQW
jgi:hypothetical protein